MPSSFEELKARREKKGKPAGRTASPASKSGRPRSVEKSIPELKVEGSASNGTRASQTEIKSSATAVTPQKAGKAPQKNLLSPSSSGDLRAAAFDVLASGTTSVQGSPEVGTRTDSFASFYPPSHPRARLDTHPSDPSLGRGVFAKKPISPGQVILSLPAHAAVLDTSFLQRRCSACFLEDADFSPYDERDKGKTVRRCTRCFTVSYCSATCQRLDWASHKLECEALNLFSLRAEQLEQQNQKAKAAEDESREELARVPSSPVRALARLMWRKEREKATWWENLLDLEAHYQLCDGPQKEKLMQLALALSRFVGANVIKQAVGSAQELLAFCSRFTDNSFGLTSPTLDNIGVVVSPPAAMINHSCVPNAVIVYPEGGEGAGKRAGKDWVRVIAIKPIAPDEEILTSYVDISATGKERRAELSKRYFFDCKCPACVEEPTATEADPRDTLKCPECTTYFQAQVYADETGSRSRPASRPATPNPDGEYNFDLRTDAGPSDGQVKPEVACPSCGFSRVMDIEGQRLAIKRSGVGQNGPGYLTIDPDKAAHYADRAIDWLQLKLAPFTCGSAFYPILDLRRLKLIAHLLSTKDTRRHLAAAGQDIPKVLEGMHQVYGLGHPVTAVTKATVAKLCMQTMATRDLEKHEDPRRVVQILKSIKDRHINALEDIAIGFGPNSRVGRSVAEAVAILVRDMAHWQGQTEQAA